MPINSGIPHLNSSSSGGAPTALVVDAVGLAALIGRKTTTIRADLSRRPWTLPPAIRVGKRAIWLVDSVLSWLKQHEQIVEPPAQAAIISTQNAARRRGRPTKAEQLARAARMEK